MKIGVPRESFPGERRVAVVPEVAGRLAKAGHTVAVETGAGERAGFLDEEYRAVGATIAPTLTAALEGADVVLRVRRPVADPGRGVDELGPMRPGALVIALLDPRGEPDGLRAIAQRGVTAASMELVPRITRAQMMDALSSQSTVAGSPGRWRALRRPGASDAPRGDAAVAGSRAASPLLPSAEWRNHCGASLPD